MSAPLRRHIAVTRGISLRFTQVVERRIRLAKNRREIQNLTLGGLLAGMEGLGQAMDINSDHAAFDTAIYGGRREWL